MEKSDVVIYTIGHSTRPLEDFIELLKKYNIAKVVDIRTIPGSRYNPLFNREVLAKSLRNRRINYTYKKDLGGFRRTVKDSINTGWKNSSFRAFADYMQTDDFDKALNQLIKISGKMNTVIMCAEAVPWRCHRSLIADALTARGVKVKHILSLTSIQDHAMTSFGKIKQGKVYYPEA